MDHPSFQSLDTRVVDSERKRKRFFRGLTIIILALTLVQLALAIITRRDFNSLIGTFGSLFLVLSMQLEDNVLKVMIYLVSLGCVWVSVLR